MYGQATDWREAYFNLYNHVFEALLLLSEQSVEPDKLRRLIIDGLKQAQMDAIALESTA